MIRAMAAGVMKALGYVSWDSRKVPSLQCRWTNFVNPAQAK